MTKTPISEPVFFYILIRSWNAFPYFDRCVESVFWQSYKRYHILFVDDASGYTSRQKDYIRKKLKNHIVVFNWIRKYSVRNAYEMLYKYAINNEAVVFNLDGDDWLYTQDALSKVAAAYRTNKCLLTYGSCLNWNGIDYYDPTNRNGNYDNTPYSRETVKNRIYRHEPFRPLHPRTWKVWLFKKIKKSDFLYSNGSWPQTCEDLAMFFPMMEMAGNRCKFLKDHIYIYNTSNPLADYEYNREQLKRDENIIRNKTRYSPITYLKQAVSGDL